MLRLAFLFIPAAALFAECPGGVPWQERLKCEKTLQIEKASRYFNADSLIRELVKSPDVQELGYQVIRHTGDLTSRGKPRREGLLLRVTRKRFTTRFTVSLVDTQTQQIYIAEESSSLGGSIEPDLAKSVVKWIRQANGRDVKAKQ